MTENRDEHQTHTGIVRRTDASAVPVVFAAGPPDPIAVGATADVMVLGKPGRAKAGTR